MRSKYRATHAIIFFSSCLEKIVIISIIDLPIFNFIDCLKFFFERYSMIFLMLNYDISITIKSLPEFISKPLDIWNDGALFRCETVFI